MKSEHENDRPRLAQEVAQELRKGVIRDIESVVLKATSNRKTVSISGKKLKKWVRRLRDLAQYLTGETELDLLVVANRNGMDVATLEEMRNKLDDECNEIQLQLDLAKARAYTNGEYADPGWFARAKHALRCRRSEFNRLAREIATIRKADRVAAQQQQERIFVEVCRERFDEDVWTSVWAEVSRRSNNQEDAHDEHIGKEWMKL